MLSESAIENILLNPQSAKAMLDVMDAEDHLLPFIRLMWPVLEPGRTFVEGWAVEAICDHLEAVSRGEIKRLLINVPPGAMKSLTTGVFWPAWEWGPRNRPSLRYVSWSYSEQLTVRDNQRGRNLIRSKAYQKHWGNRFQLVSEQSAKSRYATDKTGFRVASSVSGLGTGERGDRLIIDDPHNVKEAESDLVRAATRTWFAETVPTRVNDMNSTIVVIMQRVHEQDVSGMILEELGNYEHLMLPMEFEKKRRCTTSIGFVDPRGEDGELLWPARFPEPYVDELKTALRSEAGGDYAVAGQLQQRPAPRGGGMLKEENFQYLENLPTHPTTGKVLGVCARGWDLAATDEATSAFTAGVRMWMLLDGRIVIDDVARGKWLPSQVEDVVKQRAVQDEVLCVRAVQDLPQDPGAAGVTQRAALAKLLHGHVFYSSTESGSKTDRARPFASQVELKNVYLVRGDWNKAFIREAGTFPVGRYKDQIDAATRAYGRLLVMGRSDTSTGGAPESVEQR